MIGWLAAHQLLCLNLWKCSHTRSCLCEMSDQTPPQLHSALITYWKGTLSAPPMTQYSEQNFLFWSVHQLKLPRNFRFTWSKEGHSTFPVRGLERNGLWYTNTCPYHYWLLPKTNPASYPPQQWCCWWSRLLHYLHWFFIHTWSLWLWVDIHRYSGAQADQHWQVNGKDQSQHCPSFLVTVTIQMVQFFKGAQNSTCLEYACAIKIGLHCGRQNVTIHKSILFSSWSHRRASRWCLWWHLHREHGPMSKPFQRLSIKSFLWVLPCAFFLSHMAGGKGFQSCLTWRSCYVRSLARWQNHCLRESHPEK